MNRERLTKSLQNEGYQISDDMIEKLITFANYLVEQNKVMNLTTLITEEQIIHNHFIDSLVGEEFIEDADRIIDVGCGAGFPSLPLKILNPQKEFYLIDSLNKRIEFIQQVIKTLNISKITAEHIRVEEAGQSEKYREKFDTVIARGVAPLNVLLEYSMPLLRKRGKHIAYKGQKVYHEIDNSQEAFKKLFAEIEKIKEYTLKADEGKRFLLIVKKLKDTPSIYPRNKNRPRKQPL